ncbi:MAG: cytochrome c oxidase assembly protein [Gammaproteobacteria bacterium]|nr:cytochrome c oxidase assembly protein [Gammaproteobacteria bacterium]
MESKELASRNRKLVGRLGIAAVVMFGFGFAMVPLYNVFCDITGLNGKTGRIEAEAALGQAVDMEREVTVEFVVSVNSDLPWEIKPMVRQIKVHPGAVTEVKYAARNITGNTVIGQAVPSLVPGLASKYFNKTECFCFTQQTLAAGEYKEMPLRFVVDPALPKDVSSVALSYTFYRMEGGGETQPGNGLEKITLGQVSMGSDPLEPVL